MHERSKFVPDLIILKASGELKFAWDTLERSWKNDKPKIKYLFVIWDKVYNIKYKFEFIF